MSKVIFYFKLPNISIFSRHLNFSYAEVLYRTYDVQLTVIIKPLIIEISGTKDGHVDTFYQSGDAHNIARKLFQLYVKLKAFSDTGFELYGMCDFLMKDYFNWFAGGVDKFCNISVFSALTRYNSDFTTYTICLTQLLFF